MYRNKTIYHRLQEKIPWEKYREKLYKLELNWGKLGEMVRKICLNFWI